MRTLRSHLQLFTLSILLPVVLAASAASIYLAWREHQTFEQGGRERIVAVVSALDAELGGLQRLAQNLATFPSLAEGNLGAFRSEARSVLDSHAGLVNIYLSEPGGRQLINLRAPDERALHPGPALGVHRWVLEHGRPAVGDMTQGTRTGGLGFIVKAPVLQGRVVRYVLSIVVEPTTIDALLQRQDIPADWLIAVIDGQGQFVARRPGGIKGLERGSVSLLAALQGQADHWTKGSTRDGLHVFRAHGRSVLSHWRLSVAVPAQEFQRGFSVTLGVSLAAVLGVIGLALLSAWWMGRRIDAGLAVLNEHVRRFGTAPVDEPEPPAPAEATQIAELVEVRQAFDEKAAQVEQQQRRLQEADQAKDVLLAMLGHELRNPLAALSAASAVVSSTATGQAGPASQVIQRQCLHIGRLVEDLLDVNASIHGKLRLERHPVDLAQVAAEAIDTYAASGRLQGLQLARRLEPAWVDGDEVRLAQVVMNLLDNAAKHAGEGGQVRVEVTTQAGEARLSIADSGDGLTAEQLASVFDLFYQAPQPLDRPRGGMGLGLTLVKRLAELHGGRVEAHSAGLGQGACFVLALAAITPPSTDAAPTFAAAASPSASAGASGPASVLVVEDNADLLESMAALLTIFGLQVFTAGNGEQALAAFGRERPRHMLVDIGLPDMSGLELARRVRGLPGGADVHLVALSGFGSAQDKARAAEAGFDAHLTKPVDPAALEAMLTTAPLA